MPAQASQGHFRDFYDKGNKSIGGGAFAKVYKCVHKKTGKEYAVKIGKLEMRGAADIANAEHEAMMMAEIGYHPHVVQMIEYFTTADKVYIVLELMHAGTLKNAIKELHHYSEQNAAVVVRNVLSALQHIHSKGIIHRDLKPENVLLRYSETNVPDNASHLTDVCLADVGVSGKAPRTSFCGTDAYMAPEVARKSTGEFSTEKYGKKCDMWPVGVIACELLTGQNPFRRGKDTCEYIVNNEMDFSDEIWHKVKPAAKHFVSECLQKEPEFRPEAGELLKHPWVTGEQPDIPQENNPRRRCTPKEHPEMYAPIQARRATQLHGGKLKITPPFMRYLRHPKKYSTVVYHQSQTKSDEVHTVDFGRSLNRDQPGFRLQDCCTCPSKKVCRHIQNVHVYLFVGCPDIHISPLFDELERMQDEAEAKLRGDPNDAKASQQLRRIQRVINAAEVFDAELTKVPSSDLKESLAVRSFETPSVKACHRIIVWWRRLRSQVDVGSLAVALDGGR